MKTTSHSRLGWGLAFYFSAAALIGQGSTLLSVQRSEVTFISIAPLEHIAASNAGCTGLLDPVERTFAVQVPIILFEGFNSPLQRVHFNENYLESHVWPTATFVGRIIEDIDLHAPGSYSIRAKGTFTLHGVDQDRVIPCNVVVGPEGVRITAMFDILLADHAIRVPRIVQQKISSDIKVKVDLLFKSLSR